MKETDRTEMPTDTRLADELAEDEVLEMANRTSAQTGIAGTLFISTAMGQHGPRVGDCWPQPAVNDFIKKLQRV